MSETPKPIRGMQSMIGDEADRFHTVVAAFDRVRRLYGFRRVEVPVLEPTAVFARTMGETTDVVSKEMYSFEDRGGDSVTLAARIHRWDRPRLSQRRLAAVRTAQGRDPRPGVPLRAPAKGSLPPVPPARCRNHSAAAEPQADVELLAFGSQLLAELGIGGVTLKLNTLGDGPSREAWRHAVDRAFRSAPRGPERGQPGSARLAIRCAFSTARIRATVPSPIAHRR